MLQLLHMLDKWTEYLDCGGQTDADFEKAFDKVPQRDFYLNFILMRLMIVLSIG